MHAMSEDSNVCYELTLLSRVISSGNERPSISVMTSWRSCHRCHHRVDMATGSHRPRASVTSHVGAINSRASVDRL